MSDAQTGTPDPSADAPTDGAEGTSDLNHIATELASTMPQVQEHAVTQAQVEQLAQEAQPRDKSGTLFDPATHVTGPDGKGVLTVRGTWAQKRGRKANSATSAHSAQPAKSVLGGPAAPPTPQMLAAQEQASKDAQARASGIAAAEMLFMVGQMIGGEEWAPMQNKTLGLDERPLMQQAFADYFVATGKTDIPPGSALAIAIIAYAAPRFTMPKTQTRFQKIKGTIVTWWTNRKLRKMGLGVQVQPKTEEKGA